MKYVSDQYVRRGVHFIVIFFRTKKWNGQPISLPFGGATGAVSLPCLQAVIGVDDAVVKAALRRVCSQDSGARCVERGESSEILTGVYMSALAAKAEETTRTRGRIALTDLSSKFELPIHVSLRRRWCVSTIIL